MPATRWRTKAIRDSSGQEGMTSHPGNSGKRRTKGPMQIVLGELSNVRAIGQPRTAPTILFSAAVPAADRSEYRRFSVAF
jgi:hypothetical protein